MSMLHNVNNTPATPISEISKWGTEDQVSDFIEDIWPINWTRESFNNYLKHWRAKKPKSEPVYEGTGILDLKVTGFKEVSA